MLKKRLADARKHSGMSMSEVSRRSNKIARANRDPKMRVTQGYISRLESGQEKNPSIAKIKTLCVIYGILPNRIIRIEEVKSA